MNIKEKENCYKKMMRKYCDVLSKICIYEEVLKGKNPIEIEISIIKIYLEELKYNLGRS